MFEHPFRSSKTAANSLLAVVDRPDSSRVIGPPEPKSHDLLTLGFTYFVLGVTVSLALVDRGVSNGVIFGAAILVFSATSELAYVAVSDVNGPMVTGILSAWLVAARFGILATTLGGRLQAPLHERITAAICSFDPNVALATQQPDDQVMRRVFWRTTAALTSGWWLGSGLGLLLANLDSFASLTDTSRLGLDVIFPAALLAIIGGALRQRQNWTPAAVGAITLLVLLPFAPAGIPILASAVGAFVGVIQQRRLGLGIDPA